MKVLQEDQLTVKRLIELLSHLDGELPVESEGCDCYGKAHGIEVDEYNGVKRVIICRGPE